MHNKNNNEIYHVLIINYDFVIYDILNGDHYDDDQNNRNINSLRKPTKGDHWNQGPSERVRVLSIPQLVY